MGKKVQLTEILCKEGSFQLNLKEEGRFQHGKQEFSTQKIETKILDVCGKQQISLF